jgi:GNAT superfamily N-acetyltransferase
MDLLDRLERFYDAVPRDRAAEEVFGGLSLFVRRGAGWPFYARPRLGGPEPAAGDVARVLERQRELGIPEAFEWVHQTTPGLAKLIEAADLEILHAPLLVLDGLLPAQIPVRILDPEVRSWPRDIAACNALVHLAFNEPGTAVGKAGPEDLEIAPISAAEMETKRDRAERGASVTALIESALEGPLATGQYQRADGVAEIVGIGTLPTARRRGLAGAVTAALAGHAREHGVEVVFLSAGSDDVARVYERVGFRRVGTACIASPRPTGSL